MYLNKKLVITAVLFIFQFSLWNDNGYCQGIEVYPSRLFFHSASNNSEIQVIHITNKGKSTLILNTYLKDWLRDSTGNKVYYPPTTLPHSNASWITTTPSQLSIDPGKSKELTVQLKALNNSQPFTNAMLFLSQINQQDTIYKNDENGRKVGLIFKVEVGIHIYNTTPSVNPTKKLKFISLKETTVSTDSLRHFETTIKNEGEDATDATIRFNLTETTTGQKYPLTDRKISMFPGAIQIIQFNFPKSLPKGNYQIIVIGDAGDNSTLQIAKKQITYE